MATTYYVDLYNGIDKPTITNAVASNLGGAVKITYPDYVPHGLSTGEQVVLTLFTAYINGTRTITVIDDYNFTLDGLTWATTADQTGTCTPVTPIAGTSWATAWKSLRYNSQVEDGDIIKISKTPDSVSIGNAAWTNKGATIVLSSAATLDIDTAIGNTWTMVAGSTGATSTNRHLGATSQQITAKAGSAGKIAYKALPSALNLSGFTKVSCNVGSSNLSYFNNANLRLCLCSDTNGDVVVDSFIIPNIAATNVVHSITLTNGVALGNSINSIAIYRDTGNYALIRINNIFAANSLHLLSIIGKSSDWNSNYYAIQSISGLNVVIDQANANLPGSRGCYETTETVETFTKESLASTAYTSDPIIQIQKKQLTFSFGWDVALDVRNGNTCLHGSNYKGDCFTNNLGNEYLLERLTAIAFRYGITNADTNNKVNDCSILACDYGLSIDGLCDFNNIRVFNCNVSIRNHSNGVLRNAKIKDLFINGGISNTGIQLVINYSELENVYVNNNYYGFKLTSVLGGTSHPASWYNIVTNLQLNDNQYSAFIDEGIHNTYINCDVIIRGNYAKLINPTGISDIDSQYLTDGVRILDKVNNIRCVATLNCKMYWQTTVKQNGATGAWCLKPSTEATPYGYEYFKLAEIGVKANEPITVRVWVKLEHLTGTAGLFVRKSKSSITFDEDLSALALNHTNWQELSIYLVPTETGVIRLEVSALYNYVRVYVGSISYS